MSTLSEMNTLVSDLRDAVAEKKKAEDFASACEAKIKELKGKLSSYLNENNLDKYVVAGVGQIYLVKKESFTTPKTNEQKEQLFNYIKEKYGAEDLVAKLSIHSATLNSWANQEMEANASDPIFRIPGLDEPVQFTNLTFKATK